ncbi:hypothetical protein C8R43DRAFT_942225 [Mycena crocata]|nr:hypothetical protein C8R43DRAFT_942225 [Mycena crocata]
MLRCCWRPVIQLGRLSAPTRAYSTPPNLPLNPLKALKQFLAPTNLTARKPVTYTPKALHQFYLAVKALPPRQRKLGGHPLNVYELTELLVLFGSLSLPPPLPKCIYVHSFVSHIPRTSRRTYWPLVFELAEQIRVRQTRKPLSGTYHYWLMRAHLARMRPVVPDVVPEKDDAATEATACYVRICRTADPEVHLPYLRTMFQRRRSTHLSQIVKYLCKVLNIHANPHHRFADLLWTIILADGAALAAPLQERVVATLWTRLETHPYMSATRNPKPVGYAFDTISMRHIRLGVSIPQLCAALATTLFPHFRLYLPPVVWTWAVREAKAVFSPQRPVAARWSSIVMLALYAAPTSSVAVSHEGGSESAPAAWRTVFALAMFERTVPHGGASDAVRRLWRTWKNTEVFAPPLVRRVIVGAFFRLAARTQDRPLKEACRRYCVEQGLWGTHVSETKADLVQTTELLVDYAYAALHTGRHNRANVWQEIFATLPPDSNGIDWRASVSDSLFRAFFAQDVAAAHELYTFCQRYGIALSTDSAYALSLVLAARYPPVEALRFLNDERFSADQVEELMDRIGRTLRRERHTFRDVSLANVLTPALERLYLGTDRTPGLRTKFSLRYLLSVLAASERFDAVVPLMREIHQRQPAFFSIRYFLRMMRVLADVRQSAALALLRMVRCKFSVPAVANFRRKLTLKLARRHSHSLARRAYRWGGVRDVQRTAREALARAVGFRVRAPEWPGALSIEGILARRPDDVPTLRYAVSLLVSAGRVRAAREVLARAHVAGVVDGPTLTWLGNMIINGALHATTGKNARMVRHVLNARDELVRRHGFVQDRVTINIVVKALLRWRTFMDSEHVRRLFDYLVRCGYPGLRDGVRLPFETAGSGQAGKALWLDGLPALISYDRHVQPLYKMFIKAFYLQGDRRSAQTVMAILHAAEADVLARRQKRRKRRLAGIIRKKRSATKRKLADAFHSLDQAVESTPPPAKKPHTLPGRSLYATLAKYGVKPKPANPHIDSLSKSTPHLTAILARAANRTRKALPFPQKNSPPPPLPPTAEYRPSHIPSFLARLATFKLTTYANKPPQLDAVAAAKCGWTNDGKDRLVCGLCGVSWVVAGREGMARDAGENSARRSSTRTRTAVRGKRVNAIITPASIYRIPLQAPAVMLRELKSSAVVLDPIMEQMEVKHPLTASQLASLRATITALTLPTENADAAPPPEPSDTALLTTLFGWAPAPPSTERTRVSSLSRPSSRPASRAGSPFPATPPGPSLSLSAKSLERHVHDKTRHVSAALRALSDTELTDSQRRVGLWAFAPPVEPSTPPPRARAPAPQRQFDLLKEHRSFCPYVVRSTVVPTLPSEAPSPSAGVLEGWRAVLTVVLRYGMGQRQRMAALRRRTGSGDSAMEVDGDADTNVDGVEAMVASVKSRGGKELLKYFVISAGCIVFRKTAGALEICILHDRNKDEWLLPKGRKDCGESIATAAVREAYEETGYPCELLPCRMPTRAPRPGVNGVDAVAVIDSITEPFSVVIRDQGPSGIKIIWWYLARCAPNAEKVLGTQTDWEAFDSQFVPADEAAERLTFQNDRDTVLQALQIVRDGNLDGI